MTDTESKNNRLTFAGVAALTVLTWYALPDAVRSRGLRAVIKTGLLGVTAAGMAMIPQVYPDAEKFAQEVRNDVPESARTAAAAGAAALAVVGTIWGEKVITHAVSGSGRRRPLRHFRRRRHGAGQCRRSRRLARWPPVRRTERVRLDTS